MTPHLIPSAETLTVEFKSDLRRLSDDEIVEAAVCFANSDGGTIFIGVEDDGDVTGLHSSRPIDVSPLAAMISNRTTPSVAVSCREVGVAGKRVCVVEVPKSFALVARSDGLIKRRQLDSHGKPQCIPFLPHEFSSRAADTLQLDMAARPVAGSTLDDFDPLQRERLRVSTAAPNRCFLAFWKRCEDFG